MGNIQMFRNFGLIVALCFAWNVAQPHTAHASGDNGHGVVALVGQSSLEPDVSENVTAQLATNADPYLPTGPIEKKYYATGPWTVTTGVGCCDSKKNHFDLYYPMDLGANGVHH